MTAIFTCSEVWVGRIILIPIVPPPPELEPPLPPEDPPDPPELDPPPPPDCPPPPSDGGELSAS
ncbi:hypothetical protein J15TS10_49790 [Paenibacillus woosongensis]|uniref:Uncharacterized protein n=1 Tax=Paenibacillus woosongensis TaxID=307580 RepID=A0ABQ4MZ01_9BACL|nr:hypothetical protein J15TS10_49790 [Paenibacillus woosongensis]